MEDNEAVIPLQVVGTPDNDINLDTINPEKFASNVNDLIVIARSSKKSLVDQCLAFFPKSPQDLEWNKLNPDIPAIKGEMDYPPLAALHLELVVEASCYKTPILQLPFGKDFPGSLADSIITTLGSETAKMDYQRDKLFARQLKNVCDLMERLAPGQNRISYTDENIATFVKWLLKSGKVVILKSADFEIGVGHSTIKVVTDNQGILPERTAYILPFQDLYAYAWEMSWETWYNSEKRQLQSRYISAFALRPSAHLFYLEQK